MYCYVVQPNGVVLEVQIEHKSKGQDVLEKVCEVLGIRTEMDYFGLKYHQNGKPANSELWLNLRNSVERQVGHVPPIRFRLKVKFWVPPHLVLQESTRHQMCNQVKEEVLEGRLHPTTRESKVRLAALLCQVESQEPTWSATRYRHWAKILLGESEDDVCELTQMHGEFENMKRSAAEYWVLNEVSSLDEFGEEIYEVKNMRLGIGPNGVSIYQAPGSGHPEHMQIPYTSILSTSTLRSKFQIWFLSETHSEEAMEIKCDSNATASCLYRALTERHDFYSCDTVRGAVTSQYIRDLKGTIASIFNESTPLGKKYVFDIRRTCREVHDDARRALYTTHGANCIGAACTDVGPSCANSESAGVAAEKLLNSVRELFTCRVCMDKEIDAVFFPCAHVVCCSGCCSKLDSCPLCRAPVESSHKLYLPHIP
ncbi:FERM central domain [Nesidiocoris tenuis]|uniref:FERM central domain n=1 Tax=Nesidiocoris tenuis TaxID=355587 RepID=A0ABN7BCV9_9HEMI|nr:FERM central domain [Nesidiocoris tenuis]